MTEPDDRTAEIAELNQLTKTYMKLGGWRLGLLINFNVRVLKMGIRRRVL